MDADPLKLEASLLSRVAQHAAGYRQFWQVRLRLVGAGQKARRAFCQSRVTVSSSDTEHLGYLGIFQASKESKFHSAHLQLVQVQQHLAICVHFCRGGQVHMGDVCHA